MVHVLRCAFDVALAVPPAEIGMTAGVTSRPFAKSKRAEGGQLPVSLRWVVVNE
jgi:hypothetical protein